ncbi:hypothetical protein PQ472_05195 [Lacticaseibacillus pabuli]|uniref:Uncharacterized protein n=1 Tax=Lacticaseibacillus pabuli TaxID=3025672 RepID=A0ABY7WVW9_9LACO|nr:hypothetical protein [Lacticaseibacillus sp. KACC 23028]WDF83633.1 hypothetical protein PQ472_05195 [Lacticaseibacillus sp. KACC 23028]
MEDMTTAVAEELAKWWPEMTIYRENQKNGFAAPSFYVHRRPTTREPDVIGHDHELRTYQMEVLYTPPLDEDGTNADIDAVRDQMLDCLHIVGGKYRVTNWNDAVSDDTLVVTFDLPIHVAYEQHPIYQGRLDYTGDAKDGKD